MIIHERLSHWVPNQSVYVSTGPAAVEVGCMSRAARPPPVSPQSDNRAHNARPSPTTCWKALRRRRRKSAATDLLHWNRMKRTDKSRRYVKPCIWIYLSRFHRHVVVIFTWAPILTLPGRMRHQYMMHQLAYRRTKNTKGAILFYRKSLKKHI